MRGFETVRTVESSFLFAWLPARTQGLGSPLAWLRVPEQFGNGHVEGGSELVEIGDRRVLDPPLDPPDVSPVNAGVHGELLLRHARRNPDPSQVPSNQSLPVHP